VARLMAAHPGQDIVVVAHFGAILTQVQTALQLGAYEAFAHKIDNLSVTEIAYTGQGWRLGRLNHLP
jgi:broad specificity phosphatase PhoE